MAITIKQDIEEYLPAYNRIEVVVDSTNKPLANFKYIFDLYIEGVAGFIRFKVAPEPVTGQNYGTKDFMRTLESHVQSFIPNDDSVINTGFQFMDKGIKKYHIQYGEEYEVAGVITQFPDDVIGADKYIWNSAFTFDNRIDFDFADYDLSGSTGQWLTDNKTFDINYNNLGYCGVIASNDADIEFIEIKTYDSAGALINTFKVQNTLTTGVTPSKYLNIMTGTKNLNNITTGLVVGAQPIITTSVASYTLQMLDASSVANSDILTFNIKEQCNYPIRRLHFQNRLGAFDTFNFDLVSKEDINIEKKSYKFKPNTLNGAGSHVYNVADRSNINYRIKNTTQLQLNASYITEEQSEWLEQLFTSPEIYLEWDVGNPKNDKRLISVAEIQSNVYRKKTDKVDNLFNVDLIITLSNNNYRQRR